MEVAWFLVQKSCKINKKYLRFSDFLLLKGCMIFLLRGCGEVAQFSLSLSRVPDFVLWRGWLIFCVEVTPFFVERLLYFFWRLHNFLCREVAWFLCFFVEVAWFLAALSSPRILVVCPLVGWSVGPSNDVCEKVTFRVSKGN